MTDETAKYRLSVYQTLESVRVTPSCSIEKVLCTLDENVYIKSGTLYLGMCNNRTNQQNPCKIKVCRVSPIFYYTNFYERQEHSMGKTIFIGARKGGVGKTTTAASLGVGLAREGKKTLVIDTDSQFQVYFLFFSTI